MPGLPETILVTGATGYVGGRLVPALLDRGHRVRCLCRDRDRLQGRSWAARVEVVEGDVLTGEGLAEACRDVGVAYYLIHSLGSGADFESRDRRAASSFGAAARDAGVRRIVYLGGLGDPEHDLSEHLRSRQGTGDALRESGVALLELRAGIIVGSGSLSFEMIRYLTERVPVMVCPRWVYTKTQPIAIRDVLGYLVAGLDREGADGRIVEIGGADVLSYGEMMLGYARARGLHRLLVPVPALTPRLSSYWVHLVTPIPASIARPLVLGLRNEVVVRDDAARRIFPEIAPMGYDAALQRSLARLEAGRVETAWTDALTSSQGAVVPVALTNQQGMIIERRQRVVAAGPERVYRSFASLGGERGWLYANWLWQLRGLLDRLVGGVGMRRGRRDPRDVRPGDAVDFWRVEAAEPGRLLRLRAEMKVPGRAWLQFEAAPQDGGRTVLTQTAFFAPRGLPGWLYWSLLYPAHGPIFSGMIARIAADAEAMSRADGPR